MKIICSRKELFEGVQTAGRAVSARSSLPILGHILIRTGEERVSLAATDLEIGVECTIPAQVEEAGSLTVPARVISEVLSTLPDTEISLSVDENNRVTIKWGTSDYEILGLPPEEFPMLPDVKDEVSFKIEKAKLKRAIQQTSFAVSQDESRASLTGILLQLHEEGLRFVSTDTHRLCLVDCELTESQGETQAIVPGRAMAELQRVVEDEEGTVDVAVSHSQILFKSEQTLLISRLIEGQFPNFQKVVPQDHDKTLIIPTEQLQQSVRRAAIVARDDASRVVMRTDDAKLTITAESSTVGKAYEEVDVARDGEDIEMAFSAKYMLDFLAVIDTEAIEMQLTGALSPALLKPQDSLDYTYVLMPMQIR